METRTKTRSAANVVAALLAIGWVATPACGVDHGGLHEIEQRGIVRDATVSDLLILTDVPGTGGAPVASPDDAAIGSDAGADENIGSGGTSASGAGSGAGNGQGSTGAAGAGGSDPSGSGAGAGGAGAGDTPGTGGALDEGGSGAMVGPGAGSGGISGAAGNSGTGGGASATGGTVGGSGGVGASYGGRAGGGRGGSNGLGGRGGHGDGSAGGTGGSTTAMCDARTCPGGCCAGRVCVQAPSASLCGRGGGACQACGSCQRCSFAGACELDPQSHWQLSAVSAVLNGMPPYGNGRPWDPQAGDMGGPLPDPFAQFEIPIPTVVGTTSTILDTTNPMWKQPLLPPGTAIPASDLLPGGAQWKIWIGDEDANQQAQVMCDLNGPIAAGDFAAGGFTRMNAGSCYSVTIGLTCIP